MTVKILAVSDIHLDEDENLLLHQKTLDEITSKTPDILLIGGDIGETKETIEATLKQLSKMQCIKLAYLGNHELRTLKNSKFGNHYQEMKDLFEKHNFHLLDYEPFIYQGIGFVGNIGWFDFSLYRGQYFESDSSQVTEYHYQKYPTQISPTKFTDECITQIQKHLKKIEHNCNQIILGIHHIAFPEFLKYGHSQLYDLKNLIMGSNKLQELYQHPKITMGFCGHTHRSGEIKIKNTYNNQQIPIMNISSDPKKPYVEIELETY